MLTFTFHSGILLKTTKLTDLETMSVGHEGLIMQTTFFLILQLPSLLELELEPPTDIRSPEAPGFSTSSPPKTTLSVFVLSSVKENGAVKRGLALLSSTL